MLAEHTAFAVRTDPSGDPLATAKQKETMGELRCSPICVYREKGPPGIRAFYSGKKPFFRRPALSGPPLFTFHSA